MNKCINLYVYIYIHIYIYIYIYMYTHIFIYLYEHLICLVKFDIRVFIDTRIQILRKSVFLFNFNFINIGNMKRYQIMVWTFTGIISFVFFFNTDCQGQFDRGICWIKIDSTYSPCLWGYFLFWIIIMYVYQVYASVFAYLRLRKGLPLTFEIRKQCAIETFKCLSIYASYLSIIILFFIIISSSNPNPDRGTDLSNFSLFLLFVIANRGSVDGVVWFMLHDFMREKSENEILFFNDPSPNTDKNDKINENDDPFFEDDEIKISKKDKRMSLTRMSSTLEGMNLYILI
jgi:hypothetical protein